MEYPRKFICEKFKMQHPQKFCTLKYDMPYINSRACTCVPRSGFRHSYMLYQANHSCCMLATTIILTFFKCETWQWVSNFKVDGMVY